MLDETCYEFGTYVEGRVRVYGELFSQLKQDEAQVKSQSSRGRGKGSSPPRQTVDQLKAKRLNMQKHLQQMYEIFAYGRGPDRGVRVPRRLRNLSELRA